MNLEEDLELTDEFEASIMEVEKIHPEKHHWMLSSKMEKLNEGDLSEFLL